MNNDMTITGPFLKTLVKRFESQERTGLVSPKIKYEHHPDTIQYAGYTPMHPIRISNNLIGVNQKDRGQYDHPSPQPMRMVLVYFKGKVIEKAGMMTEIYFLFYEEIDWSIN